MFIALMMREVKVLEFINLCQRDKSDVKEFALKFTQMYKYAQTMIAHTREKMIKVGYQIAVGEASLFPETLINNLI